MDGLAHQGTDGVIVVGAGVAGLAAALTLAPMPAWVLSAAPVGGSTSTGLAQGGVAAAIGPRDHPGAHATDTIRAGAGLVDGAVAALVADGAVDWVPRLERLGLAFDRRDGRYDLALEAAHSRRRVLHAGGDRTGASLQQTLVAAARATLSIELFDDTQVLDLLRDAGGRVVGVLVRRAGGLMVLRGRGVILATGGIGGLYRHTTNPLTSVGAGLAVAARAGAELRDLEFVQFHPTALDVGVDPMPLASEAVRGEGAVLINDRGERFMANTPGGELAPRDVVTRAIQMQLDFGGRVFLDARAALGNRFAARFPGIDSLCRAAGIDPAQAPIPARPAAHFHMGGVGVDVHGRTSLPGLWACGEVAATGLHGANRLASNALVEGLVFGARAAQDAAASRAGAPGPLALPGRAADYDAVGTADLRHWATGAIGVWRDDAGLRAAMHRFAGIAGDPRRAPEDVDRAIVGLLIAVAAWRRCESRGAHARRDHPGTDPMQACSRTLTLAQAHDIALTAAPQPERRSQ